MYRPGGTTTPHIKSNRFFDHLGKHSVSKGYASGQVIFAQGEAADAIFRVETGNVKLTVKSETGKIAVIAVLRAGECFGEGCLEGKSLRSHGATSIGKTTVGRVSKRAMLARLHREPVFARTLTGYLLQRMGRVEEDLVDQLLNTSERRLARLLLQLSDFGKVNKRSALDVMVDQGTLAQAVGTTRSRVSHFLNEFRKKGFIDYNGNLQVHKALLTYLHDKDTID